MIRIRGRRYRLRSDRLAMIAMGAVFIGLVAWDIGLWRGVIW